VIILLTMSVSAVVFTRAACVIGELMTGRTAGLSVGVHKHGRRPVIAPPRIVSTECVAAFPLTSPGGSDLNAAFRVQSPAARNGRGTVYLH